mmetsp:Transcript_25024/g.53947  ORF Transcript_25024/g.53947 Transcript_25024/m.53947 type:complete len:122 (+) Transcript_25024:473-838(+)
MDNWDNSMIAEGAVFNMKFDAQGIPDRIQVEYPTGNVAHDTGWRGDSGYDGDPLYPGGVIGPWQGEALAMFSRINQDTFQVTVIGPDPNTAWDYDIRCRNLVSTSAETGNKLEQDEHGIFP